jgi:protease-4
MKGWMKITLLIIIIFICVGIFYYFTFSQLFEGPPPIAKNSYLELNIYGELPERELSDPITRIFTGDIPSLDGVLQCIRKAKVDPSIKGLILRPLGLSIGWAKTEEIKQAVRSFKESGKPVYVYLEIGTNREYYLALEGDMIFGPPANLLLINGLLGGAYYFKNTLDKIGVEADYIAIGKYKSAPNMLTQNDMNPEDREVVTAILDDVYARYIEAISSSRNMEKNEVKRLIDHGIYDLRGAYEKGLIDTLMYYNEFRDYLKYLKDEKPRLVSYSRYKKAPFPKTDLEVKKYIALVYCLGDIVSGFGEAFTAEGLMIAEGMADAIRQAAEDDQVKAIVLRIDSPGGSGPAADIIWREVQLARVAKPVIVSMSDVAASGGYYIGMPADSIFAQPSSIVGSIGVFSGKFSLKGLYNKLGITKVEIPRGANSTLFSEIRKFDEKQRRIIQENMEIYYREFVTKVSEGRNLTYEEVDGLAQGRVWTGAQAAANGLIDQVGGIYDAINSAKKMAGFPVESYVKLKIYPREKSYLDRILSEGLDARQQLLEDLLPIVLRSYLKGFFYFQDYEPLFILPFFPEIR